MNKKRKYFLTGGLALLLSGGILLAFIGTRDREAPPVRELSASPAKAAVQIPPVLEQKEIQLVVPEPRAEPAPPVRPELMEPEQLPPPEPEEPPVVQVPEPESAYDEVEAEQTYYRAMIFRDDALATFPVHTVQVHQPTSVTEDDQTDKIGGSSNFGPKPNEVWIRIKPENAREMKEIMAQTADLYRHYVSPYEEKITVTHWVGGQPWARMTFDPDGNLIQE